MGFWQEVQGALPNYAGLVGFPPERKVETDFLRRTSLTSSWDSNLVWNGENASRVMREGQVQGF